MQRLISLLVLTVIAVFLVTSPCLAGYAPSTDPVLNAYVQGCLAQDFQGPIDIETSDFTYQGIHATYLMITVTKDSDISLRPFLVYEMAQDLKGIGGQIPDLWSVTCKVKDGKDREVASLEWDVT